MDVTRGPSLRGSVLFSLRAALIAVAALVAGVHGSQQPANADMVDVGTNPVQVVFTFPPHDNPSSDPSTWPQINVAKNASLACAQLPQQACSQLQQIAQSPLLTQNFGTRFDDQWSKTTDKNGKTQRDLACDKAKAQVASNINQSTGQNAYNINCNFPATGRLTAAIDTQEDTSYCPQGSLPTTCGTNVPALELQYYLSNMEMDFAVTEPNLCDKDAGTVIVNIFTGGSGCIVNALGDPTFTVTFDAEVDVTVLIPSEPCAFNARGAEVFTRNANINGSNTSGQLAQFASSVYGTISPDHNAFPAAEQTMDDTVQPISIGLGNDLGQMEQGCSAAVWQGFGQFKVIPDPNNGLTFELIHPMDKLQITGSGASASNTPQSGVPSLINPTITAAPTTVPVKDSVTVSGNYFPGSNANQIDISWGDPGDEQLALKETDIQWGTPGSLTTIQRQRTHDDDGWQFNATNLKPSTQYEFMVRDCDNVTCSQYSNPLMVTTGSDTGNQVTVYLDSVSAANSIGTALPDPSGAFSQGFAIPAGTKAGQHTLIAAGGSNQQAQPVTITVLGANQAASAELDMVDPNSNARTQSMEESYSYTADGSYFTSGGQVSVYLDTASGKALATATVAADGTFSAKITAPSGAGSHSVLAVETVNGQTTQASASVYIQALPR
jgi:hypothetical protein